MRPAFRREEFASSSNLGFEARLRPSRPAPPSCHRNPQLRRLNEQAELERELDVVRPVAEAELFLDALFVGVDGLRADEQPPADLGRRVALRHEPKDVALTLRELVEPIT